MTGPAPVRRSDVLPADYPQFLAEVKAWIAAARTRAVLAVNSELIRLYWEIGHEILEREQREGWGAKVINRLAEDLRREFPDMTGLSLRNLRYMRAFARAWPADSPSSIVQQPVAQLPWGHNVTLLDKLDDSAGRLWYASQAVENGWSRNVLQAQIASDLRGRQGTALTSFEHALPESDSELVRDAIKDPYNFEFLGLAGRAKERDLERALLRGIDSPVAIARYTTGEVTLTQTPPPEMQPALPDLPALASELSDIVEAANAAHDDGATEDEPGSN
jgi:predicted nuclease of restriction endonuclease-like (RecB) superfamily